jgi:LysR family glycine cleavage system transcriptional activator
VLKATALRLSARQAWTSAIGELAPDTPGQTFEHFYFSLQVAVAGLGIAIGPWHLVRNDLDTGVLAAPLGFVEDGSRHCLLSPERLLLNSLQAICWNGCGLWRD